MDAGCRKTQLRFPACRQVQANRGSVKHFPNKDKQKGSIDAQAASPEGPPNCVEDSGTREFEQVIHETDAQGHEIPHEPSAEIRSAAFAPDGYRVALHYGPDNIFKLRLSIFDIRSGKKERDLWPVEWTSYSSGPPTWAERWTMDCRTMGQPV